MTAPTKTESREERILRAAICRRYILEIEAAVKDRGDWKTWMFRLANAACDVVRAEEGDEPAERIWDALCSLGQDHYGWLTDNYGGIWAATYAQRSTRRHFQGTGLTLTAAIADYIRDFEEERDG